MNNIEMKKSFFKQVAFTNKTFGNEPLNLMIHESWSIIGNQALLVKEEFEELLSAKNKNDIRDAICDIYVTNLGLAYFLGMSEVEFDIKSPAPQSIDKSREHIEGFEAVLSQMQGVLDGFFVAIECRDVAALSLGVRKFNDLNTYAGALKRINVLVDMWSVFESNLSKVCKTKEDAQKTVDEYRLKGVMCDMFNCPTLSGAFVVKVTQESTDNKGKLYPKNKFLKCVVSFKEPQFD